MFQASAPMSAPKMTKWSTNCRSTVPPADGGRHLSWNTHRGNEVEGRCKQYRLARREGARGDDGGDGVGAVSESRS